MVMALSRCDSTVVFIITMMMMMMMMTMMLKLNLVESHEFRFREPLERLANILRKWSKLCISFDFDRNEAQMAFNGKVRQVEGKSLLDILLLNENLVCNC